MAEQSYIFDFTRTPTFFENFNIKFSVNDMYQVSSINSDGSYEYSNSPSDNFELVWVDYGADNISDYLNNDGTLKSSINVYDAQSCGLDWVKDEFNDVRIELHDEVEFTIGDTNIPLKAILLRDATSGFIMGYSINMTSFSVTYKAVFDSDVIFWNITRLNNYG